MKTGTHIHYIAQEYLEILISYSEIAPFSGPKVVVIVVITSSIAPTYKSGNSEILNLHLRDFIFNIINNKWTVRFRRMLRPTDGWTYLSTQRPCHKGISP